MAVLLGLQVAVAPPVAAGECSMLGLLCGRLHHYSPDAGLDIAILVRCRYGDPRTTHAVPEGGSSRLECRDADEVYNRVGQEIWCKVANGFLLGEAYQWRRRFAAPGWHKITDAFQDGRGCTVRVARA